MMTQTSGRKPATILNTSIQNGKNNMTKTDVIVSTFPDAFKPIPTDLSVSEILCRIKDGFYSEKIAWLRTLDKEIYDEEKKSIPAIAWSGTFKRRKAVALIQHSGLLCVDFDDLGNPEEARKVIDSDSFTWASFVSPSGCGLKVLVQIIPDQHYRVVKSILEYYLENYGLTADDKCKDVCRLCFVSYDPNLFQNENAAVFELEPEIEPEPVKNPPLPSKDRIASYCQAALKLELRALAESPVGQRNFTLNKSAYNLGQLIAVGGLDQGTVEQNLTETARTVGLKEHEIPTTIRSGITAGLLKPRAIPEQGNYLRSTQKTPYVLAPGQHIDDQGKCFEQPGNVFSEEVLSAIPDGYLYRRGKFPGELEGEEGNKKFKQINNDKMRLIADKHVSIKKWFKKTLNYHPCTRDFAGLICAAAETHPNLRDIEHLVNYPTYGKDWNLIDPGWSGGVYYDQPPELRDLKPILDIEKIREIFLDLVIDFPFENEASRANFFGLLLTPIISTAINGNRPLTVVTSVLERTGKSKLVEEVFGGIILGRPTPAMNMPDREEERDKRIMALLLQGETILHLDNLPQRVDSAGLASLLTASFFLGRLLGTNQAPSLPNKMTLVATANHFEASGEIAKRTIPISLQPTTDCPESRSDFVHPDLRVYIQSNRIIVLGAILGAVEAWKQAGQPRHPMRFGGFEEWAACVGGILSVLKFDNWRKNEMDWKTKADPKTADKRSFVSAWKTKFQTCSVTLSDLMLLADEIGVFSWSLDRKTERGCQVAFGAMMRKMIGMPVGEFIIRGHGVGSGGGGRAVYWLENGNVSLQGEAK